jgi:hypothetical protein
MSQPLDYQSPDHRRAEITRDLHHWGRRAGISVGLALLGFGLAQGFGTVDPFLNGTAAAIGGLILGWAWTKQQ